MKNARVIFSLAAAGTFAVSTAYAANPVTVPGDFATIQGAIDSWCTGGSNAGETAPFVINVDPASGPYTESMTLNDANTGAAPNGDIVGDIVIQSSVPGTLVDLRLNQGADSAAVPDGAGARDGIWIYQNVHDVTFTDFIFSPALASTIDDDLVKIDKNSNSAANTHTFNNCVFTDVTDGVGGPMVTSRAGAFVSPGANVGKLTDADTLVKFFGDNAEYMIANFNRCVFASADCVGLQMGTIATAGGTYEINVDECVFGYVGLAAGTRPAILCNGNGAQLKTLNITGSDVDAGTDFATVFYETAYHSVFASTHNADGHAISIDNTIIHSTVSGARGYSGDNRTALDMQDVIISTVGPNVVFSGAPASVNTWDRVTFHVSGAGTNAILTTSGQGSASTTNVSNAIFSGLGTKLSTLAAGIIPVVNIDYAGFPTAGPDAIGAVGAPAGFTVGANIVNDDPQYASKTATLATYFDVQNPTYLSAGTAGSHLGGGAGHTLPVELDTFNVD